MVISCKKNILNKLNTDKLLIVSSIFTIAILMINLIISYFKFSNKVSIETLFDFLKWDIVVNYSSILSYFFPIVLLLNMFIITKNKHINLFILSLKSTVYFSLTHLIYYIIVSFFIPSNFNYMSQSASYLINFFIDEKIIGSNPLVFLLISIVIKELPVVFSYSLMIGILARYNDKSIYWYIMVPSMIIYGCMNFDLNIPYMVFNTFEVFDNYPVKISDIWKFCTFPLMVSIISYCLIKRRKTDDK